MTRSWKPLDEDYDYFHSPRKEQLTLTVKNTLPSSCRNRRDVHNTTGFGRRKKCPPDLSHPPVKSGILETHVLIFTVVGETPESSVMRKRDRLKKKNSLEWRNHDSPLSMKL